MKYIHLNRKKIIALFILFILSHILFYKLLLPDKILGAPGSDSLSQGFIFTKFAWDVFKKYHTPAWYNPYLFCGMPFVESCSYTYIYPPNWIFLFLPVNFAFGYQYILHLFLGSILTFLLANKLKNNFFASFFLSISFIFSSHVVSLIYPGHGGKVFALSYFLPLFLTLKLLMKKITYKRSILFIFLGILQIFTGHLQIVFYTHLFIMLFLFFYWISFKRSRKVIYIFFLFIAIYLGASYKLLSILSYKKYTVRNLPMHLKESMEGSLPISEVREIFWANIYGYSSTGNYHGYMKERLISDYIMPIILFFSFLALWKLKKIRNFYLFVIFLSIFISFGKYNPFLPYFYKIFFIFKYFRAPMAILCLFYFSLSLLAYYSLRLNLWKKATFKESIIFVLSMLIMLMGVQKTYFHSFAFFYNIFLYIMLLILPFWKKRMFIYVYLFFNILFSFLHLQKFIHTEDYDRYKFYLKVPYLSEFVKYGERILFLQNELTNKFMLQNVSSLYGYHPLAPIKYLKYTHIYDPLKYPQRYNLQYIITSDWHSFTNFKFLKKSYGYNIYKSIYTDSYIAYYPSFKNIKYNLIYYDPQRIKITFNLEKSGFVTILENAYNGWKILDNGKKVQIIKEKSYPFFVIKLSKGMHTLCMKYSFPHKKMAIYLLVLFIFYLTVIKYYVCFFR